MLPPPGPHRQRGAVLTEVAITLPLFFMLIFGLIEFGMLYRDHLTLANTTRDAARTGTVMGDDLTADYEILRRIKTSSSAMPRQQITKIVVFKASTVSDAVPADCVNVGPQPGLCNVYDSSHLDPSLTPAAFNCGAGKPARYWCPTTREVRQSSPPDILGVYVEVERPFLTGLFGSSQRMRDTFLLRIEPTDL